MPRKTGNYKIDHVKIDGFDIIIENPKGSVKKHKVAIDALNDISGFLFLFLNETLEY